MFGKGSVYGGKIFLRISLIQRAKFCILEKYGYTSNHTNNKKSRNF